MVRSCDIVFAPTYVKIFLGKSKTDVYRDHHWIYLSASDSKCCPVKNLRIYMHQAGIVAETSEEFLIRAITNFSKQNVQKLRVKNTPLSYTTARETFLAAVVKLGLRKEDFGLHSLRSGGETAAANAGDPDRLFKRHGRWKSETVKDGYVQDDISSLLVVSQCLGL